jgi:hypothetical protein
LYLKFIGEANSDWTTGSRNTREVHEGREVYIGEKTYLLGGGGEVVQMLSGFHQFNFEIRLPPNLPRSLESRHGSIRYWVEGRLDIPWSIDKTYKVDFKVFRQDDYSGIQDLIIPRIIQCEIDNETFFSRTKGSLHVVVSIPHSVFTPGSEIPIKIHLESKNNKGVSQVGIKLKQIIDYHR